MARPKGVREYLPRGMRQAIEAAKHADLSDPEAQEAMGVILEVMRAERPGRHAMARLKAATTRLAYARGLPVQPVKHSGSVSLLDLLTQAHEPPED